MNDLAELHAAYEHWSTPGVGTYDDAMQLIQAVPALLAELTTAREHLCQPCEAHHDVSGLCGPCERVEVERLRQALRVYGAHLLACASYPPHHGGSCTCGLSELTQDGR